MPARVSPVERIRAEIDQLFADPTRDLAGVVEDVARLGARLLLQSALEAEVTAFLGRERYQRDPDAEPGSRNGHQPITVKTTSGPLSLNRPKLRGTAQRFASQLLGAHVTRTNALEALVIAGFVRGLSTRDVEATLAEVKAAYWQIFDDLTAPSGQAAVDEAVRRAQAFAACYEHVYPAAVACLTSTLDELTVHLRFPTEHWQRIRHTNLLERTFGEPRRRTKVIGRLPSERSCLRLVWAVLDRASRGWRGLTYTPAATRLLQDLRRDLFTPPIPEVITEPATTAA